MLCDKLFGLQELIYWKCFCRKCDIGIIYELKEIYKLYSVIYVFVDDELIVLCRKVRDSDIWKENVDFLIFFCRLMNF